MATLSGRGRFGAGPQALVVKHGEYGATIFFREGAFGIGRHPFRAPALPIEEVKDPTGANVQLVIGGLTEDPADAPGPFGVYLQASTHIMQRSTAALGGLIMDSQDWTFAASTGERLELHIQYERGVANKGNPNEVKFYSAKNPSFFQISRQEQVLDILKNVTTNPPDRVKEFSFKGSGGSFAKLFDGTEKVLSWDNILWINRSVMLP